GRLQPTPGSRKFSSMAIVIPPLIYFAFCLINFQGAPDLLPLFPFIGIFAGWFFVEAVRLMGSRRIGRGARSLDLTKAVSTVALTAILILLIVRSISYRGESGLRLDDQKNAVQVVSGLLGPDDRIYVHGTIELLVLLNRANLNPYIMFDEGKDDYI